MQKKYEIICNEGSLTAGNGPGKNIKIIIHAPDEEYARMQFAENQTNRMYGRYIKEIREA